jgi:hypothetical protein
MGVDMFSKKSDMMKAIGEHLAKVKVIHALPEYQEFLKYREELEQWSEFVMVRRLERMQPLMEELFIGEGYKHDDTKLNEFIVRIKKLEKRLSDIQFNKSTTFCSSNIMDLVWEYFKKYGSPVEVTEMFDHEAFRLGNYIMTIYSGQGEYGYSITKPKRIF